MNQTLQQKYPDVKICTDPMCKLTERQHEAFYKYEQEEAEMAKKGVIRVMFTSDSTKDLDFDNMIKVFQWWNGQRWVTL